MNNNHQPAPLPGPGTQLTLPTVEPPLAAGMATVEINVWNRKTGDKIMHEKFEVPVKLALEFQRKMAEVLLEFPGRHSANLVKRVGSGRQAYILDLEFNKDTGQHEPDLPPSASAPSTSFAGLFRWRTNEGHND